MRRAVECRQGDAFARATTTPAPGDITMPQPGIRGTGRRPSHRGAFQAETLREKEWWARQDSNLQPDRYERSALTIELQALTVSGQILRLASGPLQQIALQKSPQKPSI
ncbi:hypothetical protein MPPM_3842 [Methylorubrum populi]|uniref:Uncharacterized protein n=1 Tax=Methylorubrum populi TaxID=223967 RepID=A0A160PGJ3_9HYPH|nr:hypothetical protein MPPM_3842 [Methylorubrum populi]